MKGPRLISALAASLSLLAASALFAACNGCSAAGHTAARCARTFRRATVPAAAVAAAWIVISPLAAAAVPVLFAVVAAIRRRRSSGGLAKYVAACDRAGSREPPWWPDFEREFRRECRRRATARRPSSPHG